MFGKYLKYIFILISISIILKGESDPLYILNGTFYAGNGQWQNAGSFLRVNSDEARWIEGINKKTAFIDLSHFWVVPAFQNIWFTSNPDSTYQHYPYVQTDIPLWSTKLLYANKMKQGLFSFYLYPESPFIRSGNLVNIEYPGLSHEKGLIINSSEWPDSALTAFLSGHGFEYSAREKNLLLQWKNQQIPVFIQGYSQFNEPVIKKIMLSGHSADTITYYPVSNIQDMKNMSLQKNIIIKDTDPAVLLRDLHLLEDSLKIRILDILTGYNNERRDSLNGTTDPHFLFLDRNPLESESRIKFIMINGTFSLNP
jgi:hypothetical protein